MGNYQSKVDNDDQKQSVLNLKDQEEIFCAINKECLHIRAVCDTNEVLRKLQLKLAIFELKTFKMIKYPNKCGHYEITKENQEELKCVQDCKEQAPDSFPSSDVFMCVHHLKDVRIYFDSQMTKVNQIQNHVDDINKHGSNFEKNMVNSAYSALQQVGEAFYYRSEGNKCIGTAINDQMKQPKYYWSLLMTKLLTIIRYVKIATQVKTTQHYEILLGNMLKLLILYRYVMNPSGAPVLNFVVTIMTQATSVLNQATSALNQALNAMVVTICNSVIFGYAGAFVAYIANSEQAAKALVGAGIISVAAGVSTGVGTATISEAGAIGWVGLTATGGVAIGGGVVLLIGGVYLLYRQKQNQQGAHVNAIVNQHLNIVAQNISGLQQENDEQRLIQMLQDLEQ